MRRSLLLAGVGAFVQPVRAQEQEKPAVVEVTGTRITSPGITSNSPFRQSRRSKSSRPSRSPWKNSSRPCRPQCRPSARAPTTVPAARLLVNCRITELGPRYNDFDTDTLQYTVGLKGALISEWTYDAYSSRGESDQTQIRRNWGSLGKVGQALNALSTWVRRSSSDPAPARARRSCAGLFQFRPARSDRITGYGQTHRHRFPIQTTADHGKSS